jgi:hypothetical protein
LRRGRVSGFGLLGGLFVLRALALQRWYRASEVRERIVLLETEALAAKVVAEEMVADVRGPPARKRTPR